MSTDSISSKVQRGLPRRGRRPAALAMLALVGVSCTTPLPDQDLRILDAVPIERLSTAVLRDDFRKDAAAATERYRAQAIVVTGQSPEAGSGEPGQRYLRFVVPEGKGVVRAFLLDDQAAAILEAAPKTPRVTLKCFCEGLVGEEVVLKSCVAP